MKIGRQGLCLYTRNVWGPWGIYEIQAELGHGSMSVMGRLHYSWETQCISFQARHNGEPKVGVV
jgi:hypothetical protein